MRVARTTTTLTGATPSSRISRVSVARSTASAAFICSAICSSVIARFSSPAPGPRRRLSSIGDDGAHFRPALAVEGVDGLVDGAVELVGVAEGAVGQVVALQVAPGALDGVQLGRVLR